MEDEKKVFTFADLMKIKRWTTSRDIFDFPFNPTIKIGIRLLTQWELLDAKIFWNQKSEEFEIKDETQKFVVALSYTNMELLRLSCYEWDTENKFFRSVEQVAMLSVDETEALFNLYNKVQERFAPIQTINWDADVEALIEDIKKKWVGGSSLSSYTTERLLHTLIAKLEILQNPNGISSVPWNSLKEKMKKELLKTQEPIIIKKEAL